MRSLRPAAIRLVWFLVACFIPLTTSCRARTIQSFTGLGGGPKGPDPEPPLYGHVNPLNAYDVNGDNVISPLDALIIINDVNAHGERRLARVETPRVPYIDVDEDGWITRADAQLVIDYLNANGSGQAIEGDKPGELAVAAANAKIAFNLDKDLGLKNPGDDYFYDYGGQEEKWLLGSEDEPYFILPDGRLYEADLETGEALSLVGKFPAGYHADPSLLHDAYDL